MYHDWLNYSLERWALLNFRINNSENQADQCIWVLSHIKSFDVADKDDIARCIFSFATDNLDFYSNMQPDLFRYLLSSAEGILNIPAHVQSICIAEDGVSFAGSSSIKE